MGDVLKMYNAVAKLYLQPLNTTSTKTGIKNAVNLSSVTDGFLKNDVIRLPFPPDAIKVREKAINFGLSKQVRPQAA